MAKERTRMGKRVVLSVAGKVFSADDAEAPETVKSVVLVDEAGVSHSVTLTAEDADRKKMLEELAVQLCMASKATRVVTLAKGFEVELEMISSGQSLAANILNKDEDIPKGALRGWESERAIHAVLSSAIKSYGGAPLGSTPESKMAAVEKLALPVRDRIWRLWLTFVADCSEAMTLGVLEVAVKNF
jgi:hypothetical protein